MGSSTTRYDISVDYRIHGLEKGKRDLALAGAAAGKAESSLFSLKNLLLGGLAMRGLGLLKSSLIDSNASLQSMKIGMATIIGSNFHVPYEKASAASSKLVEDYQQIAKASPGTTRDFLEMNNSIISAVTASGGSLNDLKEITSGAVIASTAFGQRSDVAGRDIMQMLQQKVGIKDMFARQLIAANASTVEHFNKLDTSKRLAFVKSALTSPIIKRAAKEFGDSWDGQLSTFKDNLQITLQKVGLPLFQRLTSELKNMNAWAERNQDKITKFGADFGNALVDGFNVLKNFGAWIVANRDTLMKVVEGLLVFKGANMIIGGLSSVVAGMAGLNTATSSASTGLLGLLGPIGLLGVAIGVITGNSKTGVMDNAIAGVQRIGAELERKKARREALTSSGGLLHQGALKPVLTPRGSLAAEAARDLARIGDVKFNADTKAKIPGKGRGNVNVTIKKIEVVADDSENFIHEMWGAVGKEIRIPSQAVSMPRGA